METCVLIPQEFSLVLTASPAAATAAVDRNANRLPEMRVNVWTNARIPQGTVIYPFQGTIRLDKLEVYSYLDDNDVSTRTRVLPRGRFVASAGPSFFAFVPPLYSSFP
ncbi:hypothetical protein R5R35_010751 [Gryllus longicercus]|uniref:Uncharacterized protein n=1 Tax=Gryllus longicercus TaxID=2509291 RepID=A0AAN9YV05_9ORTH